MMEKPTVYEYLTSLEEVEAEALLSELYLLNEFNTYHLRRNPNSAYPRSASSMLSPDDDHTGISLG